MEKDTFKKIIIIKEKNGSQTTYFSHSMAAPLALYLYNKFCFVSMWICFCPGFCSVNVLYLPGLCICSMRFQIYLNSLFL